mmetsp:Transcript_68851/g.114963  ORF Transcript_68851/g.114963 Transcript_68851/m.114963 type:complete len:82 (+) Transcript_68851:262-507(+)
MHNLRDCKDTPRGRGSTPKSVSGISFVAPKEGAGMHLKEGYPAPSELTVRSAPNAAVRPQCPFKPFCDLQALNSNRFYTCQ